MRLILLLVAALAALAPGILASRAFTSSSAAALDAAMHRLHEALVAEEGAGVERLSSIFCPTDSNGYTDLLSSAQFAFNRRDFKTSRACYWRALKRYWEEYDTNAKPGLIAATRGSMERMGAATLRMEQTLARLSDQLPEGYTGEAADGWDGAAGRVSPREPEHLLPGAHAAPPGSVPLPGAAAAAAHAAIPRTAAQHAQPAASAALPNMRLQAVETGTHAEAQDPAAAAEAAAAAAAADGAAQRVAAAYGSSGVMQRVDIPGFETMSKDQQLQALAQTAMKLGRQDSRRSGRRARQHSQQRVLQPGQP